MSIVKRVIRRMQWGKSWYQSVRRFSDCEKPPITDELETLLYQHKNALISQFFLSARCGACKRYYGRLIDYFERNYSDRDEAGAFNFNGIRLPKPQVDEHYTFGSEACEFLSYSLTSNQALCNATTHEGPYEMGNVKISKGDIVMDCGANLGMFSAIAAKRGATVHAFEPFPAVIERYLSKTAALNPNIAIVPYALSDKTGSFTFVQDNVGLNASHLADKNEDAQNTIEVHTTTLDEYVEANSLPHVDFIKADIEGAERHMLMGAQNVLKEFAPKIAICTYHLPDDPEVLRELIHKANPRYIIEEKWMKMYAYVPK